MNIQPGVIVKTLSGSLVKIEKQAEPGYWYCDDGRIHLGASFRKAGQDERKLYSLSHNNDEAKAQSSRSEP
jgi:hypothetical protein